MDTRIDTPIDTHMDTPMGNNKAFFDQKSSESPPEKATFTKNRRKKISPTYLENAGAYYLQRFAASTAQFHDVMARKIYLSCQDHTDQDSAECLKLLTELIEKFTRLGYLNDRSYTENLYHTLLARGYSLQKIRINLRAKQCPPEMIESVISENAPPEDHEFQAALKLAKRKKLGPYGIWPDDKLEKRKLYQKQLAVFARQNFSYKIATTILEMDESDTPPP